MSQLTYNGVVLPYFHCTDFKQVAIRDDMADTDWHLTRIQISGHAVVNADYTELLAPDLIEANGDIGTDSAAFLMDVIRPRLLQHRRALSYTFNGVELIPQRQEGNVGTVDAENGPKPQDCSIMHLYNNMFYIAFTIHASYWENFRRREIGSDDIPPAIDNPAGNNVLFNRWSEAIEINECNFTSRVRNGKFKIRSDNVNGFVADQLRRQMAVVGVPKGFIRHSSKYTVTPDGLAIQYQLEDREVFKLPPFPTYKATGEYYETGGKNDATRFIEARVRLEAAPDTPQTSVLNMCMAVVGSKIGISSVNQVVGNNFAKPTSVIAIGASVRIGMYENWVEVWLKCQLQQTTARFQSLAILDRTVCFTPYSDPGTFVQDNGQRFTGAQSPNYPPYGSNKASKLLQAAAYYDPCLVAAAINPAGEQMNVGVAPGQAGKIEEP